MMMKKVFINQNRVVRFFALCFLFLLSVWPVQAWVYEFESGGDGWVALDWNPGCTNVEQSSFWGYGSSSNSLRMDVDLVDSGDKAWSGISFDPENLHGTTITIRVYCPAGSSGTGQSYEHTRLRLWAKDSSYNYQETAWNDFQIPPGISTQTITHTITAEAGFDSTNVTEFGIQLYWHGVGEYHGPLYIDAAGYGAVYTPPVTITNSEHFYDMETACQQAWWQWDTNPEGWHAKAWTNVYYDAGEGCSNSTALAADAVFVTNNSSEIVTNGAGVVITNEYTFQKGIFEIAYQPALNLSTKDHRKLQAKVRFDPPVGADDFIAKMYVYDKISDQWYFNVKDVGGGDWVFLEFDLDDPTQYATNLAEYPSPPGPMDASEIGFVDILLYAREPWTGTVYLDDVVLAGSETRTNYTLINSGFVQPAGHKFVLDGTNFYHCGANIEYLQTVSDTMVRECLDWAASNHIRVVRTWAMQEGQVYSFQPERGVWNEVMFEHLDRIVAEAGHRGIRLMLDVVDNWAHNGGVFQYVHWVAKEHPETVNTNLAKEGVLYHDQFWTNQYCKQWYKDYVTKLLTRTNTITGRTYRDDTTIFAWEIVNEPRCESDFGGGTIHDWLLEMSDFVRSIDTNHMLGPGEEGGYVRTYDDADKIPWEVYPDNYYHYGTYATGCSTCNLYGCGRGHGVDYISDMSSEDTYVTWQGGFYTNRESVQGEWRDGVSNINFCTARIYIDQKEYNIWRTNNNDADQRLEWINDHWYDAHRVIEKPMILEEFGLHGIGWVFNGSYGQVQLTRTPEYTFESRAGVYQLFYEHIENAGIPAGYFWNFGFEGMWEDPFHLCEKTEPWLVDSGSAATGISLSTNYVQEGGSSLKLSWNSSGGSSAAFNCPTNEKWVLRVDETSTNEPPTVGINRTKFFWNFYNPAGGDVDVALTLVGHTPSYTCMTPLYTLTSGWNRIMFDLSSSAWTWISNGVVRTNYLINIPAPSQSNNVLDEVKQVGLVFANLPSGVGEIYIDDIQIKRDDGFVVYADDPVCPIINAHAQRMNARNVATNNPANHRPYGTNFTVAAHPVDATPFAMNGWDTDGDTLSYRLYQKPTNGWIFGSPPSNVVYKPKLDSPGYDTFTYVIHDGMQDSLEVTVTVQRANFDDLRFDFETNADGWYANYQEYSGYAVTSVVQSTELAFHGAGSLKAMVDMYDGWPHNKGDAEVDLLSSPPFNVAAPINLNGQDLSINVFCPTGSRGDAANPNRIQIYAKDSSWNTLYTEETDIVEGRWVTFTLPVSINAPSGGWIDEGFDPQAVRAIGVRLTHGGSGSDYEGPIFIDAVTFPVLGRTLYGFPGNSQEWTTENWGSGNAQISWTNTVGAPSSGAIVVTPQQGAGYGKFYIKDWDRVENETLFWTPILQAYVWVPCDAPANYHHAVRARLVLRSSVDDWSYNYMGEEQVLIPCGWNLVSWDMSELPVEILNEADEYGIELVWGNRCVWQGPVMVDSISAIAREPDDAPAITSVTPLSGTVRRYEKYEVTVGLDHVSGLNPYDPNMVDLQATFVSPSGQVWNICGFYMEEDDEAIGQGSWRIRFAPDEIGTWTYDVTVENGMGTDSSTGYTFSCIGSDRHGPIRVSDDDGHYFEHADDTPFVGIGYCHPWDGDDEGIFANCAEHGINMIHWWMAPWDTLLTVKPANPMDAWREKSTYDTYEQGRAAELDRVVGHAEKYGVKLVFTVWPHDAIRDFNHHKWRINGSWAKAFDEKFSEPEWYINAFSELDDPPMNQKFFYDDVYREYQDRLYRYMIARWGYSEAIGTWALASELFGTYANSANCIEYQDPLWVTNKNALLGEDPYEHMDTNQCDGADYTISWLTYIHNYFADNDPFGHPTTASYGTDEYWEHGFPVIDVPQIHTYADLYNWITPPVTVAKYHHYLREHYDKPSFMGEIGTVEWKTFEPDYTRVTMWPGICSGGAITPMMWTTPAFSWFGDAKMGPWLDIMSDEAKVLAQFISDIDFHHLDLRPAEVVTLADGEPAVTQVESFESGINNWARWGNGSTNMALSTNRVTDGAQCLRLDVNMDSYDNMPDPATGIEKYEGDGFSDDWSAYWPDGTLKMDVYVPEFYHPDTNPDGYLLGINKDPRSILEVFTKDEGGGWHWYSTTNEYGGALRESGGWKKMTVGMLWNLELPLGNITSEYEAAHITGFKFKFGDVGIQRGPIYIDNMTAGRYAFNTFGMVSSNGQFAFAWIQDRTWSDDVVATNATFQINDLSPGTYYVEWWNTLHGAMGGCNAAAPTGTLSVTVPDFTKDIAVKIRRVGDIGLTVHDVAVTGVREYDWVLQGQKWPVEIKVANQGTAGETFNVTLTDLTDSRVIGTNAVVLPAGSFTNTVFFWNNAGGSVSNIHTLMATASTVAGETDTADNQLAGLVRVYAESPPWDPCNRLRRWAVDANDSDARTLRVQTNSAYVSEGDSSFEVYHRSPDKQQAYIGFDQVYEDWSNKTAFVCDMYVADGATNIQLLMRTGENWTWHYSADYALSSGWNRDVTFDFTTAEWTRAVWNDLTQQNDYYYDALPNGLEEMQQIFIKVSGYPSDGHFYVDNIRLTGEYLVHLAYINGEDFFPRATAEQTNYTGAACCWMIARYLNGDSYDESQTNIYNSHITDPEHNDEITPQSCASWMPKNTPPGYYFSARNSASFTDAVKEVVYWIDYVPPGGLKSPVYILCNTSWSYKVVRGFKTDRKPYDGGSGVVATNQFNVYGLWLNDPMISGLGYNLYASAQEISSIYLPSLTNGSYWMVAEPPADSEERAALEASMDQSGLTMVPSRSDETVAGFLADSFNKTGPLQAAAGVEPDLNGVLPFELKQDTGFMAAFSEAPVIRYYAVNTNRSDCYYLAAGGERGPRSTRYILKLDTNGALLQATWENHAQYYEPIPLAVADWNARRSLAGENVNLVHSELVSLPGGSDFHPVWNLEYEVDGTNVAAVIRQDIDLTGDSDGDGVSDGDEWYAGTDPDNGVSVFSVAGGDVQALSPDQLVLTWPSAAGKTYAVYRANHMNGTFIRIAHGVAATPSVNSYTDTVSAARAFYRIEVE